MPLSRTLAAALLCTVAAGPLRAAEGVRSVTLSSGGLAEITRVHAVDGDAAIRMQAPAEQVDDLLKSLVVRDPQGSVGSISLDGPAQAQETFRRMPFTAEDLGSPARLVGALQGVRVKVSSGGRTVEGKALGVSTRNAGTDAGEIRVLAVLTDAGEVDSLALDDGATVAILDPDIVAKVAEAAAAVGRTKADGAREIEIRVVGQGKREVGVSYVVAAPVWKAAYRIVDAGDGKARLQAWAVIENATGEDWDQVAVTLSSGSPVTLRQRLHQRYWRERPEIPVDVEGAAVPDIDRGAVAPKARNAARRTLAAPAPQAMMAEASPPEAFDVAPAADVAEASEGDVSASYALPFPVDLAAGRTLSVPIVDAEVASERVAVFRAGRGPHPVAALMIRNGTAATLPPGVVTVYDARAGYVGDARLPSTPAGDERMASFATDRKVDVTTDARPEDSIAEIAVVDGVARITVTARELATYRITGAPDGDRTVIVEQPRRDGWTLRSDALSGETPTAYRLRATVAAGQTVEVTAALETTRLETFELAEADEATIASWATSATDPAVAAKLAELARARAAAVGAEREIAEIVRQQERIATEQSRIRQNLAAVPRDSALARTYLARMTAQENELDDVARRRGAAEERLRALVEGVRAVIRTF
jgi:hypothetical protein